ncbi:hypothetical protein REPUB_Repub08aG0185600 [Reevesia pubescens]
MVMTNKLIEDILKKKPCSALECKTETLENIDTDDLIYFEGLLEEQSLSSSLNILEKDYDDAICNKEYGAPPNILAENALNQFDNLDFFDISLVDGFNVPMEFSPSSRDCTKGVRCTANILGQCPNQLKAPRGCNNPCTIFKTDQYCCNSGNCGLTDLSKFFKTRCPDAYSYPKDDETSTFTYPGGTDYRVVFCP